MTLFASLSLGCALPPLAALATLSNLPAASAALGLSETLLGVIAAAVLLLTTVLAIGIYRRRLPEQPYPDNLLVKVGRRTLRLPGRRLTFLQLVITALDVAAAATVLYLLLPEAPPFGAFMLIYLLALAAGVLSHVPGGVGVFEAILLAAFADKLGAAPLAAALLLYRLIYVVLPLLVACLFLLINEASACSSPVSRFGRPRVWRRRSWRCWCSCPAWCCCSPVQPRKSTPDWNTSAF